MVMGFRAKAMNRLDAALEDRQLGLFIAEAVKFFGFVGLGLAKHPGHNAGLKRLVTAGGEFFIRHGVWGMKVECGA